MNRYHIKIGFEPKHISQLKELTEQLNYKNWLYSNHCIDNLKFRAVDLEGILLFIKGIELILSQIFEFYTDSDIIVKVCYRIGYNNLQDLILVITPDKKIITIYMNSKEDLHFTLKKELYNTTLTK
jgi:hypothetical protein